MSSKLTATTKVNPDLAKERERCSFTPAELTIILDGGSEKTKYRRELEEFVLDDPDMKDPVPPEYMPYSERYDYYLKKACLLFQKTRDYFDDTAQSLLLLTNGSLGSALFPEGNPLTVHFGMFLPTLVGQGNTEQHATFLSRAWDFQIIGTYAQTELGHGTNVRGLETTAIYDPQTEEFVLHSPTVTSLKWWPGTLGKTANYAVVVAQLWSKGKCYGIHSFVVQLRDEKTHEPMPGIQLGDIGARFGLLCNDNGYLRFDHYRIPRTNMLMKHAKILQDGTYISPPHDKLRYGTMVFVRVMIVLDSGSQLKRAVTIATRYSAVRRQSEFIKGQREPQVLDYQTQQYKLLPLIAGAYAIHFAAYSLFNEYNTITDNIDRGNLDKLPELHALSCGLKALASNDAVEGTAICLRACGGHGYLTASNLPRIYSQAVASCIYEGENTVLLLQVARSLVKAHGQVASGQNQDGSVAYLTSAWVSAQSHLPTGKGLVHAFQQTSAGLISEASACYSAKLASGLCQEESWNNTSVQLMRCAIAHIRTVVVERFYESVEATVMSSQLKMVMRNLFELYAFHWLIQASGDFVRVFFPVIHYKFIKIFKNKT